MTEPSALRTRSRKDRRNRKYYHRCSAPEYQNAQAMVHPLQDLYFEPSGNYLVTTHRAENVDNPVRLADIMAGIRNVSVQFGLSVVFPMHPRMQKMGREYSLSTEGIQVMDPVGYWGFLVLESKAALLLTDSGGIWEEGCILNVPCLTIRDTTERSETVDAAAIILPCTKPEMILVAAERMMERNRTWINPFGKSDAARRILEVFKNKRTL